MDVAWSSILQKAGLPTGANPEPTTSALSFARSLLSQGFRVQVLGGKIVAKDGNGVGLQTDVRAEAVAHKPGLLVLFSPRPKAVFPVVWKQEWSLERDILLRRLAASSAGPVRDSLQRLANAKPASEGEWMVLGEEISATEYALRLTGELPEDECLADG